MTTRTQDPSSKMDGLSEMYNSGFNQVSPPRKPSGSSTRSIPRKTSNSSFASSQGPSNLTISPFAAARPSSSSSRQSMKRNQMDFEAALLNPNSTIFLSGSPNIGEDEPGSSPPRDVDQEAPQTVEKRSYEDDLKALSKRNASAGSKASGTNGITDGVERKGNHADASPADPTTKDEDVPETSRPSSDFPPGSTVTSTVSPMPGSINSPQIIPPTPSSTASTYINRRTSQATMQSQDSTGSPSQNRIVEAQRRRLGPSLGIDAELHEVRTPKKSQNTKRRSIFQRSPGTASSPDLATLVKKAKERRPNVPPQPVSPPKTDSRSPGLSSPQSGRHVSQPGMTPSQSIGSQLSTSSSRERAGSRGSATGTEDGWEKFSAVELSSLHSRDRMPSIAESSRRESEDNNKSLRNKAKGVFGKMFGGSTSRDPTPRASPATSMSSKFGTPTDYPRPPVPPIPANYAQTQTDTRRRTANPPVDAFGLTPHPATSASTQKTQPDLPESVTDGTRSVTPTGKRRASDATVMSVDKPLPALKPDGEHDEPSPSFKVISGRHTLHLRQPADMIPEDEMDEPSGSSVPRRDSAEQFSKDVAGIFDGIGQTDPAKELGLPPGSLRLKDDETIRSSVETAREPKRKIPVELGRSSPAPLTSRERTPEAGPKEPTLGKILSPRPDGSLAIKAIPNRASSLPPSSPRPDGVPTTPDPNIVTSSSRRASHSPSPKPRAKDDIAAPSSSLVPPPQSLSRSSSSSSHRRKAPYPHATTSTDLGSPVRKSKPLPHVQNSDFEPGEREEGDDTIRPRLSSELSVLSPASASVRLVKSPRPDSPHLSIRDEATSFRSISPWGRASSHPTRPRAGTMEEMETSPTTPKTDEEDDDEKGRRMACEVLEDDYRSVAADRVAMFLGGTRPVNRFALRYYMQYFDMRGQSVVEAFRDLCAKLYLKAESQEIDRILEGFSSRYYECNPATVFATPGVVHTVTGAMLMLNTDLHIAELSKHMSRGDFVRNVMRTIRESAPANDRASTPDLVRDDSGSLMLGSVASFAPSPPSVKVPTVPAPPNTHRSASAPVVAQPPSRTDSERSVTISAMEAKMRAASAAGSSTTISSMSFTKAWESEAEVALKEIYSQVRADKILLPTASVSSNVNVSANRQSVISMSTIASDTGRSKLAKSPRPNDHRVNALKRGSIRSMQGSLNHPYGHNYSASDGRLSPTPSYSPSFNDSTAGFAATIGFASNLSHAVIREHDDETHSVDSRHTTSTVDDDLNDDELALYGAPWAKEGMLWKRNAEDPSVKKTTKKDWKQFFVVVQRGELLFFTFGAGSGSGSGSFGVGGGNWLNNANNVGRYSLVHTSSAIMPGGYSRDRPYVFTVTFPSTQTLFLEAGTDDLVAEWLATCNYWSARRSRPALQGGVSNMEYGWARADTLGRDDDRASVKSGKSNMSKIGSHRWASTMPADRVFINDWKPPPANLLVSQLEEESQLEALRAYVATVNEELDVHKALEEPMMRLYTPGSKNAMKAHQNFQLKAKFLVNEVYRYEAYIEVLRQAISLRVKKQGEKKLEKSLARSTTSLHRAESEGNMLEKYMEPANGGKSVTEGDEDGGEGHTRHERITRNLKGLAIDSNGANGHEKDDREEPITPVVRTHGASNGTAA